MTARSGTKDAALLIYLVHGTFAGEPSSVDRKTRKWWEKDSSWSDALQADVRTAAERLGGQVSVEIAPLQWPEPGLGPGPNLETERRRGGEAILKTLEESERAGQHYHIVAHSHGGSAVWHALIAAAAQKQQLPHLKSWTTVGTPFLTFQPAMSEMLRPAITLFVLMAMLSIWLYGFWSQSPESYEELMRISQFLALEGAVSPPENLGALWQAADVVSILALFAGFLAMALVAYVLVRFMLEWSLGKLRLRLTDSGVIRKLVSSAAAVTVVFIAAGKIGINPKAMAIPVVLAGMVLNFAVTVALARRLWVMLGLAFAERRRSADVRTAADLFGPRWRGLAHGSDEAIALMSAALLPAPSIRPQQRSIGVETSTISGDDIIKPLLDQATWRTLTQYATGDDRDGLTGMRCAVTPYPDPFGTWTPSQQGYHRLTKQVETGLGSGADESAQHLAVALRERLQQVASGRAVNASDSLMTDLSFSGLIHTSYLATPTAGEKARPTPQDRIRLQIAEWIAASSVAAPQARRTETIAAEPVPPRELQEYASVRRRRRAILRNRFRNLESVSVAGWTLAGAAAALTLIVPAEIWVRPYTRATHHLAAKQATIDEELTLRTTDAVAAGSYAVRLAASGVLDTEDKIHAFLRSINQPNTRAVAAQRLAFAFGVANKPDLANAVVSGARGPAVRATAPYIERLIGLARLSAVYGQLVSPHADISGKSLPMHMIRQADEAWNETQNRATHISVFACEDSDKRAATALYLPIRIAAALQDIHAPKRFEELAVEVRRWGVELITRCMPESLPRVVGERNRHIRAWTVTLLVDVARDAQSWGRVDVARAALAVAGHASGHMPLSVGSASEASTPEATVTFNNATGIAKVLVAHDDDARARCASAALDLASPAVLGYPFDPTVDLCNTTFGNASNPSAFCAGKRKELACDRKKGVAACREEPHRCGRILENNRKVLDEIQNECRSEPALVTGNARARVREAFAICERHGAAAGTAAVAAALIVRLERDIDAARLLISGISDADDKLETIARAELPRLEVGIELARPFAALVAKELGQDHDAQDKRTRTLLREMLEISVLADADPEGAKRIARRIADQLTDGTLTALDSKEALAGARALLAAPSDLALHRVATDVLQELVLASTTTADDRSTGTSLRRRLEQTRSWSDVEGAIRLLERSNANVAAVEMMARVVRKTHLQVESSPPEFARRSGALGSIHAINRDFNRLLATARATGFRGQVVSAYCRVLDDYLAIHARAAKVQHETERDRFGLTKSRRWPLPVPVSFGKKPRFSFDDVTDAGPPSCWATQEYDIES
jgi:hypothetical protein